MNPKPLFVLSWFLFLAGGCLIVAVLLFRPTPPTSTVKLRREVAANRAAIAANEQTIVANEAYIGALEAQIRALDAQPVPQSTPASSSSSPAAPAASPPVTNPAGHTPPGRQCLVDALGVCVP